MSEFKAIIFDAETGAQGTYTFQGSGLLISASAMRVGQAFFESDTAKDKIIKYFPEWELHTAIRHEENWVVTLTGALVRKDGGRVAFMAMIYLPGLDPVLDKR